MPTPAEKSLNIADLREVFSYNPDSGIIRYLVYRKGRGGVTPGTEAGTLLTTGYRMVGFNRKRIYCHRLGWALYYDEWPEGHIDHMDHDRSNNCIFNLREVFPWLGNGQNLLFNSSNTSGMMGVCRIKPKHPKSGTWLAYITYNGKTYRKVCQTEEEAIAFRRAMEKSLGFHENHGMRLPSEQVASLYGP